MSKQHNARQITAQLVKIYFRKFQHSNRPRRIIISKLSTKTNKSRL